jgi:alkylation response protein AidB-like acyl-CoA dehydrogenase
MPGPDRGIRAELSQQPQALIYGGSNEIQRNIIAKAVLGL